VETDSKNASRTIVRYEGVGLSMLRNVKNMEVKNKCPRKNQGYNCFFVIKLHKNSVTEISLSLNNKIPNKSPKPDWLVKNLWKTAGIPVETLWNEAGKV